MRQLTPLDAQFLAIETSRTYGHVGGLAVYDPSTATGGRLGIPEICQVVIVADRDQIPDVWPLLHAAQHEVDRLAAALHAVGQPDEPSVTHPSHAR